MMKKIQLIGILMAPVCLVIHVENYFLCHGYLPYLFKLSCSVRFPVVLCFTILNAFKDLEFEPWHLAPVWIGLGKKCPTMHYFEIPGHTQSMEAYMIQVIQGNPVQNCIAGMMFTWPIGILGADQDLAEFKPCVHVNDLFNCVISAAASVPSIRLNYQCSTHWYSDFCFSQT